MRSEFAFLLVGGLSVLTPMSTAGAQGVIEEVVVTATKREQTLQDIPVAVTVTAGEVLEDAQVLDILDLQSLVPSLRVTQLQTSTQTNFLIRGFGNGANNPGIESSVGVFVDGVYRSRSASQIGDFLDIERVEVLRGPQSTLFGQNASAGVISIVTRMPEFDFNGTIEAVLGNYDARQLRGRVTGPISDRTAYSLAGSINQRDGYFDEIGTGFALNERDRWNLRGQLLLNATDDLALRFIADSSKIDEACCGVVNLFNGPTGALIQAVGGNIYTGDPFDRRGYLDRLPTNIVENDGISMHVDWTGRDLRLQSITALRQQDVEFDYDADFTSADLVPINLNLQEIDTVTQEFRVSREGDGALTWLLGAYFVTEDVSYDNSILYGNAFRPYMTGLIASQTGDPTVLDVLEGALGLPAGALLAPSQGSIIDADQDMQTVTLFGQADIALAERLTLTLGIAYTDNQKDVTLAQTNTDIFSSLNLVDVGFAQVFAALTGGLQPTPANIAANPVAAGTADFLSVTPCSPANPPPGCNSALALYELQFLHPVVPTTDSSDDTETTYTLRLSYDLRDNVNIYGGVSTGFKATSWNLSRDSKPFAPAEPDRSPLGGFENPYYGRYGTRFAGPEKSTVVEVGLKADFTAATVNVALFDQEIEGFQSNIFRGAGFNLANAGKQSTQGLEVEALFVPSETWQFFAAATFLDPIYDSFAEAEGPDGPTDLSGTKPAGLHDESVSIGFSHDWTAGGTEGFVRADYLYESKVAVVENVPEQFASREVGTLNMSVGFSRNDWQIMIWGRNLTDDDYLLSAFPSVAQPGSLSGYTNAPRTYGVSLRRDF
jgi:iron complex outermembrane receptor protein